MAAHRHEKSRTALADVYAELDLAVDVVPAPAQKHAGVGVADEGVGLPVLFHDVVHVGAGLHNEAVHAAVGNIVDELRIVPVAGIEDEFSGFVQRLKQLYVVGNYDTALLRANVLNGIGNSFLYAILSVTDIVLLASIVAYVLSRHHGRLISGVYIYFVLGVLVPVQATFIPLVATVAKLGGQNSVLTMIIIYVTFNLPLSILLITGYMKGASREIDEAARIDGCGAFRTFASIIAPISVPALSTAGILAFINVYNDLIFANLFVSNTARQTVTQVINGFSDMGQRSRRWSWRSCQ